MKEDAEAFRAAIAEPSKLCGFYGCTSPKRPGKNMCQSCADEVRDDPDCAK